MNHFIRKTSPVKKIAYEDRKRVGNSGKKYPLWFIGISLDRHRLAHTQSMFDKCYVEI